MIKFKYIHLYRLHSPTAILSHGRDNRMQNMFMTVSDINMILKHKNIWELRNVANTESEHTHGRTTHLFLLDS